MDNCGLDLIGPWPLGFDGKMAQCNRIRKAPGQDITVEGGKLLLAPTLHSPESTLPP